MNNHTQRVAHRGGSHLAPENTLAAFRHALTLPIDAIELDVHMSRDGHAIVFHDHTVDRRTNGTGNLLDLDLAYLRSLNAAAHFRKASLRFACGQGEQDSFPTGGWPEPQQIPTLREVLDLAKGHVQAYIEIKPSKRNNVFGHYPNIAETVLEEVRRAGMLDHVLIISFDWPILPLIKSLEPTLQTGALVSRDLWNAHAKDALDTLIGQVNTLGCNWINITRDLLTPTMPAIAHSHGLKLGAWTVNNLNAMRRFVATGVDSLTSDRPDLFANL